MHDETRDRLELDKKYGRPWATEMVVIPKALALDLVRTLQGESAFVGELSEEALEANVHEVSRAKHDERMAALELMACDRINDQDMPNTAENLLRALAMIYEGAALTKAV